MDCRNHRRKNLRRATWGAAAALALSIALPARDARAEESDYCRKVQARASADAALLFAPSIQAQGIKFPSNGFLDSGTTLGHGYQVRGQVTLSPLDMYKGTGVLAVGEADCRHHDVAAAAQEVVEHGIDVARAPALRRKLALLEASRPRWEAIGAQAEERFAAKLAGLTETDEVRARVVELERRAAQVATEVASLEARGVRGRGDRPLAALVDEETARAMELERAIAHVRSLDAWQVTATGGVVPPLRDQPVDFYGYVQVGFNFGAFFRNAAETRYLEARKSELESARYELSVRVRRLRGELRAAADGARRELRAVESHAGTLRAALAALEGSEAPNAVHARAVLGLDAILVELEQGYLSALVTELGKMEGNVDGKKQ